MLSDLAQWDKRRGNYRHNQNGLNINCWLDIKKSQRLRDAVYRLFTKTSCFLPLFC